MTEALALIGALSSLILLGLFFTLPFTLLMMIIMTPKLDQFMSDNPKFESQWFVNRFTRFHRYGFALMFDSKRYKCPNWLRWLAILSTLMSFLFLLSCIATLLL
ncbi:hypothetical protein [Aeromonas salmonicida]|uniref:hypothetical protein n=1 Tax=Aeromonas salmonicida TaxID=645 RepID=UPI00232DE5C8|nr:hypothetical protein [Aeromonas salmonicida]WCH28718.1 hypothetical protein ONZ66_07960 [Aeromonas salmonicida]